MEHIPDPDRLVFEVWNEEGFLELGFVDRAMFGIALDVPFGFERLAATWTPWKYKAWGTKKDKATLRIPDVAKSLHGALFVRSEHARQLCEGFEDFVELLPIDVDGAPWFLVHCFEARAVLDERRSDYVAPPMPHPWQRYWIVRRAVLQDDPTLYGSFFSIQGRGSDLYCGAAFRGRIERLGLAGLTFKKIGYFHRSGDREPRPLEPWFTPTRAIELQAPTWQTAELTVEEQSTLRLRGEGLRAHLGLAIDASDESVLKALTREVSAARKRYAKLDSVERQPLLLGLSALYGQLYVARLGWRWSALRALDGRRLLSITTFNRTHFIAVANMFDMLLMQPDRDVALAVAFKLARAGALPPSAPEALLQLT